MVGGGGNVNKLYVHAEYRHVINGLRWSGRKIKKQKTHENKSFKNDKMNERTTVFSSACGLLQLNPFSR